MDVEGLTIKRVCTKLESDFLLVMTSIFDHANVWSLELQQDTEMDDPVFLQLGFSPPPIHLMSFT